MDFGLTDDQREIQRTARELLGSRANRYVFYLIQRHLFHVDSAEELMSLPAVQAMTLEGEAAEIGCPTLIVAGDRDAGAQFEGSRRLFAEISGEKEWAVVKGSERNGNNVPYIVRPLMADFLAEHLVR